MTHELFRSDVERIEGLYPFSWRLGRRATGELVLQGLFSWKDIDAHGACLADGQVWRDLPTVDLASDEGP